MDQVELRGNGLLLRAPRAADGPAVTAACQDPVTQRWLPIPAPYLPEHAAEWIETTAGSWSADQELRWVVTRPGGTGRPGGDVVGAIGLHPRDATMRAVGYWTAPWARGGGVASAATRLVCRWAFAALGLGRVEWLAAVGNVGSRRVAERVGFTVEGTCRGRLLQRGERVDAWVGGLLPADLPAVAEA